MARNSARRWLLVAAASLFSSTVSALAFAQNGDGTFQATPTVAAGVTPALVAVGDFNGDGVQDLAVPNFVSNTVSVLLGNGDGTFRAQLTFGAGTGPADVAAGDFNGDTVQDLAVTNRSSTTVSVLLGNGDGTFRAPLTLATGVFPYSVAVG